MWYNMSRGGITHVYHTSNSCECMGVNGEALQLHVVIKKTFTTSHTRVNIRYYIHKSHLSPFQKLDRLMDGQFN